MTGNCLKGSRPIVVFDKAFDDAPHLKVIKEVLMHVRQIRELHAVRNWNADPSPRHARSSPSPRLLAGPSPLSITFSTSPSPTARSGSATTRFAYSTAPPSRPLARTLANLRVLRSSTRPLPPPPPTPPRPPPHRKERERRLTVPKSPSPRLGPASSSCPSRSLKAPSTARPFTRTRVRFPSFFVTSVFG